MRENKDRKKNFKRKKKTSGRIQISDGNLLNKEPLKSFSR